MQYLKMIGLAAIAAMGLMAFIGAGSASATVLCTNTDTPSCTVPYPAGTTITSTLKSGTSAGFTDTSKNLIATCTGVTVVSKTSNESGAKIEGTVTEWTWNGCSQTTDTVSKGTISLQYISGTHNATNVSRGTEVTVTIFGVSCTYGSGEGTDFSVFGGSSSTVVSKTAGGFLCPSTTIMDAEFEIKEPHALYVTES